MRIIFLILLVTENDKKKYYLCIQITNNVYRRFKVNIKKPINEFRLALIYPFKSFCFLRTYISWSHQSMTWPPQFGPKDQLKQSCPLLLQIPASDTHLIIAFSFIRTTWPSQLRRYISLRSSCRSLLNHIRKSSSTLTALKIIRRIFLSNAIKAAASVPNRMHASAPKRSMGRVSFL